VSFTNKRQEKGKHMKYLIYVMLFTASFSVHAADPWKLAGTSGQIHGRIQFVLIDKAQEKNTDIYRMAIGEVCAGKNWCRVLFWTDPKMIPRSMPLSDKQAKALKASWAYNGNNGYRLLL